MAWNSGKELPNDINVVIEIPAYAEPVKYEFDKEDKNKIVRIIEKPQIAPSNLAVTGLYIYDNKVFSFIKNLSPSDRGELEITDVNNMYLNEGKLGWSMLDGYWTDAGTFDTLLTAGNYWAEKSRLAKTASPLETEVKGS